MGMGIHGVRHAVRSPTSVSDAQRFAAGMFAHGRFQGRHLPFRLEHAQVVIVGEEGTARTVISAVFQAMQASHQDGICFFLSDISYNSTHISFFWSLFFFILVRFFLLP
jgi:hypothetical protein